MNIPIPNIPTDNLYKFVSLTGLVFLLFTVVGLVYVNVYLSLTESEYKKLELISNKEYTYIEEQREFVFKEIKRKVLLLPDEERRKINVDSLIMRTNEGKSISVSLPDSILSSNEMKETVDAILNDHKQYSKIAFEFNKSREEVFAKRREVRIITNMIWFGNYIVSPLIGAIGLLLCIIGFRSWYSKVQKLQDMILLKEAKLETNKKEYVKARKDK